MPGRAEEAPIYKRRARGGARSGLRLLKRRGVPL